MYDLKFEKHNVNQNLSTKIMKILFTENFLNNYFDINLENSFTIGGINYSSNFS